MTRDELRLELIRLTYTHGRDVAEAVGRAKDIEKYILEEALKDALLAEGNLSPEKRGPGRPKK